MPTEVLKHLGLVVIVTFWIVTGLVIYKNWEHKGLSISRHAVTNKQTYLTMAIMQTIMLPMFILFAVGWLSPTFHLPSAFSLSFIVAMLCLMLASWIPDRGGISGKLHGYLAYLGCLIGIPIMAILTSSPSVPGIAKAFCWIALVFMILSTAIMLVDKTAKKYHLVIQVGYFLLFDLSLLAVTYLR